MIEPEVSVVMPTFNGAGRIGIQLEALARQVDAPPFEVIVVDNGSSDGVTDVAGGWSDRLALSVVRAGERKGAAYARNVGVAHARAERIAFCDDDDCVGPTWVRNVVRSLEEAEFVSGVGVELPAASFTDVDALWQAVPEPEVYLPPRPAPHEGDYPILLGGNCAMLRQVFLRLEGFDQRFCPGAEDKDFTLRYMEAGGRLMLAPSMVLAVRLRASQHGAARRNFEHGRMYMLLAHTHGLWGSSPVLNHPDFRVDLARAVGAAGKAALRPRSADWLSVVTRISLRAGQVAGWVRYRLLGKVPPADTGQGLVRDEGRGDG